MSTASGFSSRRKLWTYCLVCHWLGCWLCSGGLKGCIFLCLLSWTLWYIFWCCMGKLSPLNGDPEWGIWMGVLNRAVIQGWSWYHWTHLNVLIILMSGSFSYDQRFSFEWGSCTGILNGGSEQGHKRLEQGHTGQSYGTDLGTIELISSCWLFWYLAHFSMTDGSLLKRAPVWGCERPLNGAVRGLTESFCTVLCISSNMTLPWVTLLAAGEVWSALLVMIFALGGGTPRSQMKLNQVLLQWCSTWKQCAAWLICDIECYFNWFLCVWVNHIDIALAE